MRSKFVALLFILGILFILVGISALLQNYSGNKSQKSVVNNSISSHPNSSGSAFILPSQTKNLKTAFVTEVFDGDTIKTKDGMTIRYLGINSPEKEDPFYVQALEKNKALVLGKEISLEQDITIKDRYGRFLYYVFTGNTFVNLEMVREGFAVSETLLPDVKYKNQIVNAQETARQGCLGFWKGLCENKNLSCVTISNINFNAKGNDNQNKNGEWAEIKNICNSDVSMKNWIIKDRSASNKYQFKDFVLKANSILKLYSGCGQDTYDKLFWSCPEQKYAVWNNSGDHAFLYNEKKELISDYQY